MRLYIVPIHLRMDTIYGFEDKKGISPDHCFMVPGIFLVEDTLVFIIFRAPALIKL